LNIGNLGTLSFMGFALLAASAGAQVLSDVQLDAAIKAGQNQKYAHLVSTCIAHGFSVWEESGVVTFTRDMKLGSYRLTVSGSAGRVAFLADEAQRRHRPFTASDVPEAARRHGIFVFVDPEEPKRETGTLSVALPLEAIYLDAGRRRGKAQGAAFPDSVESEPVEWRDGMGGTVASTRALAFYSAMAVQSWPRREFDATVLTNHGTYRCKIGKRDWTKFSLAQ